MMKAELQFCVYLHILDPFDFNGVLIAIYSEL